MITSSKRGHRSGVPPGSATSKEREEETGGTHVVISKRKQECVRYCQNYTSKLRTLGIPRRKLEDKFNF